MKKKTQEEFIIAAEKTHGSRYDYSKVVYDGGHTKVSIICMQHGEFLQTPNKHCNVGRGCPRCGTQDAATLLNAKGRSSFSSRCIDVHGSTYDYSSTEYVNSSTKLAIRCKRHGVFWQLPGDHLSGHGCVHCANELRAINLRRNYTAFYDKPTMLYYVKIASGSGTLFKIGITTKTLQERFGADMPKITLVSRRFFSTGKLAFSIEQQILQEFSQYRYKGAPVLTSGNTEVFMKDVLNGSL